jgi:hypothetical protein
MNKTYTFMAAFDAGSMTFSLKWINLPLVTKRRTTIYSHTIARVAWVPENF